MRLRFPCAALILLLPWGCGLWRAPVPASPAPTTTPLEDLRELAATRIPSPPDPNPRIESRDLLRIEAEGLPEVTREYAVDAGGRIRVPLAGTIRAAGRRVRSLENEIERRLRSLVVRPNVRITVLRSERRTVSVVGAVESPGTIPIAAGGTTLLEAVAQAGGLSGDAAGVVRLFAADPALAGLFAEPVETMDVESIAEISAEDLLRTGPGGALPIYLQPGDRIEAPTRAALSIEPPDAPPERVSARSEIEEALAREREERQRLEREAERLASEKRRLEEELAQQREAGSAAVSRTEEELRARSGEISRLSEELDRKEAELTRIETVAIAAERRQRETAVAEAERLRAEMARLESEVAALAAAESAAVEEREEALHRRNAEIERLSAELGRAEHELVRLEKVTVAREREEREKAEAAAEELRREKTRLEELAMAREREEAERLRLEDAAAQREPDELEGAEAAPPPVREEEKAAPPAAAERQQAGEDETPVADASDDAPEADRPAQPVPEPPGPPPVPSVWVVGLVERPGLYPLDEARSLSAALRKAGRRDGANLSAIEIERDLPGGKLQSVIDGQEILAGRRPDVELQPGDNITVPGLDW